MKYLLEVETNCKLSAGNVQDIFNYVLSSIDECPDLDALLAEYDLPTGLLNLNLVSIEEVPS